MAGFVEDHYPQVGYPLSERARDAREPRLRGVRDVDRVAGPGRDDEFLHVVRRTGTEQRVLLGERDRGKRARLPLRAESRALERIDRDVERGPTGAHPLAVVEHRGAILLA